MAESILCSWELLWFTPTDHIGWTCNYLLQEILPMNVPKPSMNTASPAARFLQTPPLPEACEEALDDWPSGGHEMESQKAF